MIELILAIVIAILVTVIVIQQNKIKESKKKLVRTENRVYDLEMQLKKEKVYVTHFEKGLTGLLFKERIDKKDIEDILDFEEPDWFHLI